MTKFTDSDIQHIFFPEKQSKLGKLSQKLGLFIHLPPALSFAVLREDVSDLYVQAGEEYYRAYRAITKHPLYTRNKKMESRALVGIYLFAHYLFPRYRPKHERKFVLLILLVTLIGCVGDTVSDEYESERVKRIVKDLPGAEKYLRQVEQAFLSSWDGTFTKDNLTDDAKLNTAARAFGTLAAQVKGKNMSSSEEIIWNEIREGIKYIFSSHYGSLRLRERNYAGLGSVDETLKSFAGAISYYTVFFIALFSRLHHEDLSSLVRRKTTMAKYRQFAVMISELTYSVNCYKSYPREFREGDFTSWVYVYAINEGYITHRQVGEYISKGLPEELYEDIMSRIDMEKVHAFFIHEVAKRLNRILLHANGIVDDRYIRNLLAIMEMQIASVEGEEKEQVKDFLHTNQQYIVQMK